MGGLTCTPSIGLSSNPYMQCIYRILTQSFLYPHRSVSKGAHRRTVTPVPVHCHPLRFSDLRLPVFKVALVTRFSDNLLTICALSPHLENFAASIESRLIGARSESLVCRSGLTLAGHFTFEIRYWTSYPLLNFVVQQQI
jgi:hypothetical protein